MTNNGLVPYKYYTLYNRPQPQTVQQRPNHASLDQVT